MSKRCLSVLRSGEDDQILLEQWEGATLLDLSVSVEASFPGVADTMVVGVLAMAFDAFLPTGAGSTRGGAVVSVSSPAMAADECSEGWAATGVSVEAFTACPDIIGCRHVTRLSLD